MSEPADGPGAPLLGRHRTASHGGYQRLIGAHRADGLRGPNRGYLFTVALLAGTASMPILAAISAGSGTVGRTALPDTSTPFIPTPSVGPVVIQSTGQPALTPARPSPTLPGSAAGGAQGAGGPALAAAPVLPAAPGPASALRPRPSPTAPATVGGGGGVTPSASATPESVPRRSPSPSPKPAPTCSPSATLRPLPLPSGSITLPTPRPTVARTPSPGGPPPAPPSGPAAPPAPMVPAPAGAADAAAPIGIPISPAPRPWAVEP